MYPKRFRKSVDSPKKNNRNERGRSGEDQKNELARHEVWNDYLCQHNKVRLTIKSEVGHFGLEVVLKVVNFRLVSSVQFYSFISQSCV